MQDGSLSNKMNPFLAGITGLGEGLLQGYLSYLTKMKMNQEQDKIAAKERQNSLLMNFRQKDYELQLARENRLIANENKDFTTVQSGDPYNKIGIEPGKYPNSLLDNWMQRNKPTTPEYTTSVIPDAKSGVEKTYSHIKGTEFGGPSWKKVGDKTIGKDNEIVGLTKAISLERLDKAKQDKIDKNRLEANQDQAKQDSYDAWLASSYNPDQVKDGKLGAYVAPDGKYYQNSASLRRAAILAVAKMPGDLNAWERDAQGNVTDHINNQSKNSQKTKMSTDEDIIKKYSTDYQDGIKAGHDKATVIQTIKEHYGIK